jgi:hypothetical protein
MNMITSFAGKIFTFLGVCCMEFKQKTGFSTIIPVLAVCVLNANAAQANTVDISFTKQVASQTPGPFAAGTAVDLKISDTATPDVLQFSISTNLIGAQQLNKLYLDLPTVETAALTAISISNSTIVGAPLVFSSTTVNNPQTGSEWAATQLLVPNSASSTATGFNDLLITFASNSITGPTGKGVAKETFDLTFQGANVTAANFLSLTSGVAKQNGFAQITLQSGATGSGTGVLGGSTVPVPGAVWLFGSALAGFVGFKRRKSI